MKTAQTCFEVTPSCALIHQARLSGSYMKWWFEYVKFTEYNASLQVKVFTRYHSNFEVFLTNDYCSELRDH